MLCLAHKAVHAEFIPAERHKGRYKDKTFTPPKTMADPPENYADKRVAYEESMRVPMLMQCPDLFKGGTVVEKMVANLDPAPTMLKPAEFPPQFCRER